MLASIISQYLDENRRLVVPQLGAFLVKSSSNTIIFSPLLKADDGVLRALLANRGIGEVESACLIDRLIFDVRYAAENGGEYLLEGVGLFVSDSRGGVNFVEQRAVIKPEVVEPEPEPEVVEPQPEAVEPQPEVVEPEVVEPEPKPIRPRRPRPTKRRGGVDPWIVIAMVIAVIAVAVIGYGFLRSGAESPLLESIFGTIFQ